MFEITAAGVYSTVYSFSSLDGNSSNSDGARPDAGLLLGHDGNLYGTASLGGTTAAGTVFRITPAGVFSTVYTFTLRNPSTGENADGATPEAALIEDGQGNFYGTTDYAGACGSGTLFEITSAGTFLTLHSFGNGTDGGRPLAAVLLGRDGNLYGTTNAGGTNGTGTLFQYTASGVYTTLYNFSAADSATNYENSDGASLGCALIEGSEGTFYGVAPSGGPNGNGTIFELSLPPAITSPTTAAATVNAPFSYQITATNYATSYSVPGLSDGLKFNPYKGLISGTPTATRTIRLSLSAGNAVGAGTENLAITVAAATPVITSATTASDVEGQGFSYRITATNQPTSFGVQGLPAGLSVNASMGYITGAPTGAGTFALTLNAYNSYGKGSGTLTLTVAKAPPVVAGGSAGGTVGTAFSYQITATNQPTSYGVQGVPGGLTVNATTGLITGTPKTAGTYTLTLNATNSAGKGSNTLPLTIAPAGPPVVTSATTAGGKVNVAFSYQITATNSPTSFGVQGIPGGLAVNATTGLISGTPKAAGKYTLTLNAYNSAGKGSGTLTLTITSG